jgi:hypothetical protein
MGRRPLSLQEAGRSQHEHARTDGQDPRPRRVSLPQGVDEAGRDGHVDAAPTWNDDRSRTLEEIETSVRQDADAPEPSQFAGIRGADGKRHCQFNEPKAKRVLETTIQAALAMPVTSAQT